MIGEKSRLLNPVCWKGSVTDNGTIIETAWSGVTIAWDNGHMASIQHNDMSEVERVPTKVI